MSKLLQDNAGLILRKAYYKLLDEVSTAQKNLVELSQLRDMFGANVIPPDSISRTIHTFMDSHATIQRRVESYQNSIREKMPLIAELEIIFQMQEEVEIAELANYIRSRQARDQRKSKRGK